MKRRPQPGPLIALILAAAVSLTGCTAAVGDEGADMAGEQMTDKLYDLSVTVTNNSGTTLTLKSASLGHENGDDGGHWETRAPSELGDGQTATVSAYSAVQGQAISLTYEGKGGKVVLVAQDPAVGANNTNGTKATAPLSVTPSIGSGRHTTAAFVITAGGSR